MSVEQERREAAHHAASFLPQGRREDRFGNESRARDQVDDALAAWFFYFRWLVATCTEWLISLHRELTPSLSAMGGRQSSLGCKLRQSILGVKGFLQLFSLYFSRPLHL